MRIFLNVIVMYSYKIVKSCKKIADFGRNVIGAAGYGLFWCGKREPEGRKKPSAMMAFFLTTGFARIVAQERHPYKV